QARLGQQRLEAVLAADGQPVLLLDADQRLVFANPAASRVLRLRAGLAAGTAMEQAITHPELQRFLRLAGARPQSGELRIEQAAYHAELNPLWDGAELLDFVCRLEDVTRSQQQKAAEREVLST